MENRKLILHTLRQLRDSGYYWDPKIPEQLVKLRKRPELYDEQIQKYGLGTTPLSPFAVSCDQDGGYIVHDHWPPKAGFESQYIHYGVESLHVLREALKNPAWYKGGRVLDLGCSSGVLSFGVAPLAAKVVGLDISARAIEMAGILAEYREVKNVEFIEAAIGAEETEKLPALAEPFKLALSNPPLAVPVHNQSFPHRDGGTFGIELPILFLDFAERHLIKGGRYIFIVGAPLVRGTDLFAQNMKQRTAWKVLESRVLDPYFNQMVAKDHGYLEQGISRIELRLMVLEKL